MKIKKQFNQNYFFDTLILMYLYKKTEVSTLDIEELFGGVDDYQNVNNVVVNGKRNKTTFLKKGYFEYDENNHILRITNKGRHKVREWFSKRR